MASPTASPPTKKSVIRRGAAIKLAAATSASPAANKPASRAATAKLRIGSTDHKAEAIPQRSRHPSNTASKVRAGLGLFRLVDSTKPAAHSPATDASAAMPRGTRTRSGKKRSVAAPRPASDHAAIRLAVSLESSWEQRSCRVRRCLL